MLQNELWGQRSQSALLPPGSNFGAFFLFFFFPTLTLFLSFLHILL